MEDEDPDPAKRARSESERPESAASNSTAAAPTVWPAASTLYAQGLQNRAEATGATNPTWSINAQQWRAGGFEQSDADGAVLKQRQQEARRAMLRRPQS